MLQGDWMPPDALCIVLVIGAARLKIAIYLESSQIQQTAILSLLLPTLKIL
jgi:hypothetical protein